MWGSDRKLKVKAEVLFVSVLRIGREMQTVLGPQEAKLLSVPQSLFYSNAEAGMSRHSFGL